MYLGICNNTELVYEGLGAADIPSVPTPGITQAKLIGSEADWQDPPRGLAVDSMRWIFREDSFDPVTRPRRGQVYAPQPGQGMTIAQGDARAASLWRIIQTKALANGSVLVRLKSLSAFEIIPAVDYRQVAQEHSPAVADSIERVMNSAFRESPTSVVDHSRAAITVLLSRWLVQTGREDEAALAIDLHPLARRTEAHEMSCVANATHIVARLHGRGKSNEQQARELRPPETGDDEFSLESAGLAIRNLGWQA